MKLVTTKSGKVLGDDDPDLSYSHSGNSAEKFPPAGGIGSVVPKSLTALCLFTLSEDSMGTSSADFRKNKAGLPRDFITHRYSPFRCFRHGFSKVLPKSRIFSFDP